MSRTVKALASLLLLTALGCGRAKSSPDLMPLPETLSETTQSGEIKADVTPQADILFVIDNSRSMENDQKNLLRNIDLFVDAFAKKSPIDFHIGVVAIYDSSRFGKTLKGTACDGPDKGKIVPMDIPVPYANGQLDPKKKLVGLPYVTKETPNFVEALKSTLQVGVMDRNGKNNCDLDGPEYEELFSPVEAALSPKMLAGPNKGFLRGPSAQLVVIFITDADDSEKDYPNIGAEEFNEFLATVKGSEDRVSTFGVISPTADSKCQKDPDYPKKATDPMSEIEKFLAISRGTVFSLCSPQFGPNLASIGREIREKAMVPFQLRQIPEDKTITVLYGDTVIERNTTNKIGWQFDSANNAIYFRPEMEWPEKDPGTKVRIIYRPVHLLNLNNGRAKPVGLGQ